MTQEPDYGDLLLEWLPAVWRERDSQGDLRRLLKVYGDLLDAFRSTMDQRLYDGFPDQDENGHHCQAWLLPYFAQLLDVRLVSPDEAGRRAELADAVAWRQRKGTRVSIEAIAEAIGRFEVEIQEGWKRVAITPRIDRPLLPEAAYGESAIPQPATPSMRARHPGLPAATVDSRYCSRAVQCDPANSGAHTTNFAGETISWRQVNRHGIPCAPASFQDVSPRTVDLRTPDWHRGHLHPRRVLLYYAPQEGFFAHGHESMAWTLLASQVTQAAATDVSGWQEDDAVVQVIGQVELRVSKANWNGSDLPHVSLRGLTAAPLRLWGVITLTTAALYRFENLWLDNQVQINAGAAQLVGCAARNLKVTTAELNVPVIEARACLFKKIEAAQGLVRLEYVTVLERLLAEALDASDSILLPPLRKDTTDNDVPATGCLRYSYLFYIPNNEEMPDTPWQSQGHVSDLRCYAATCTTEIPLFWSDTFGQPGCGVLHPDCNLAIQSGAEDGGELGACHDFRYVLRQKAVLEKLREFLPLGMEGVLTADPTLACPPPSVTE